VKLREARDAHHIPVDDPVLFLEAYSDASQFSEVLVVHGAQASVLGASLPEPGDSQCDCRIAARDSRPHGQPSHVLRVDRGQSDHLF
jgi:hypothetical protein